MAVAKSIVAISIPFVSGVASAALLPQGWSYDWTAALSCIVLFLLVCISAGKGNRIPVLMTLYYVLGIFCYSRAVLTNISLPMHLSGLWPRDNTPDFAAAALARMISMIDKCGFSEQTSALVKALLTGSRESLDKDTINIFRVSGASHILALSGLHLGVIYGLLSRMLSVLGRSRVSMTVRSFIIVTVCFFYAVVTGASPSIIRAFLFVCFNEVSRHQPGRRHDPLSALCSAATIQLVFNPLTINSIGFQLSYLAMIGIITVHPRLSSWYPVSDKQSALSRLDPIRYIWNSASLAVSCQLFTSPLVLLRFHTFPTYFLLSNLLAMPVSALLLICSLLALLFPFEILIQSSDALCSLLLFILQVISGM